jgi:hypothetical protein
VCFSKGSLPQLGIADPVKWVQGFMQRALVFRLSPGEQKGCLFDKIGIVFEPHHSACTPLV